MDQDIENIKKIHKLVSTNITKYMKMKGLTKFNAKLSH